MEHVNKPKTGNSQGKLVLIIGPSGVGKSVILKHLRSTHPEFHFPRSATTRERRQGEGDELYHFVSEEQFQNLVDENKVLESAVVHGVGRYATITDEIIPYIEQGKTVIREVDVQGFDSISKHSLFSGATHPFTLQSIFILPENTEQLIRRIQRRAPITEEELQRRIASMEMEFAYAERCTNKVYNRDGFLNNTIAEVEKLIMA